MSTALPLVFLDTNVLLSAFAAHLVGRQPPSFLQDAGVHRATFEKCIFEAYMAFRGVGGKKPDEGRGDWAERFLRGPSDPRSIASLAGKYHDGNEFLAFFWTNQILEARHGLEDFPDLIERFVLPDQREEALRQHRVMLALADERDRFDVLCGRFNEMLKAHGVTLVSYISVFCPHEQTSADVIHPGCLDSLALQMVLPSEDFEIVLAAMHVGARAIASKPGSFRSDSSLA